MKFEIMPQDWFKRRRPFPQPKVVGFELNGFEKIDNHYCEMTAEYDNGETFTLTARVTVNTRAQPPRWTVQGLDHLGHSVLLEAREW